MKKIINKDNPMEIILKFNTEIEGDKEEFEQMMKASDYYCALSKVDSQLRRKIRYGQLTPVSERILGGVRNKLWEILEDHEINQDF